MSTEVPDWVMEAVPAIVPPRGRMMVLTIVFLRQLGVEPTIAELADVNGISEAVTERRILRLLEDGHVAWDEKGIRVTLPVVGDCSWDMSAA